ncbi:MAG: hypothetical protein ACSHYB_13470 [Roseibacillus sp.]
MNTKIDTIRFVAPVFLAGAVLVALTSPSLEEEGHFNYQPNPGAMAKSPFGRTVGMALQGPITRFWDRGVGSIEASPELAEGSRPDQELFNWVTKMRESKTDGKAPEELKELYQDYAMARIEKKLAVAWKMDPRNFANYAIYQMFLWEGFASEMMESEMAVRDLSLKTLETSLSDNESPLSLLTAAQAAYDLVFAARTSKEQEHLEATQDIYTYSKMIPEILGNYEGLVAGMKTDGRWEQFSEAKKYEFESRKRYLEHLNQETKSVLETLTRNKEVEGDRRS